MTNPTPEDILANLEANPHPKQTHLEMAGGFAYITIDTHKIAYDGERWFACGQQITPRFSMNSLHQEIDQVFRLAQKIKDHVLDKTTTPTREQIKADCVGPDLPTEQTFVSIDRYRELEAELAKMTTSRDATQERVEALQQLLPLLCLGVNAPVDQVREKIEGLYGRIKKFGLLSNELSDQLKTVTEERDDAIKNNRLCTARINDLETQINKLNDQTTGLLAERERLFAKIKGLTEERDRNESSYNYAQNLLNQVWDASGWLERADNEPCAIEYIKRLKSKADREELLTVEVSKLQEGLTNYKAQVEGLTKRVEQLAFERDTERVGNKWLSETIEDLKRTTVKLPNEHTLRRLFNRHGTPEKYDDGTTIPTIERFLLIIENLCRNADCLERRFEELNAISTRVNTESEDAHATLDEMGIPRWTTVGNHNERYLSLSARIRSVFNTHTKV